MEAVLRAREVVAASTTTWVWLPRFAARTTEELLIDRLSDHSCLVRLVAVVAIACWVTGAAAAQHGASSQAFWPEVSPDGLRVLYVSPARRGPICVMDADGSNPHRVASGTRGGWFPDGRHIIAVARSDSLSRLVVMNADGTQPDTLSGAYEPVLWRPRVSPDGKTVVIGNCCSPDRPNVFQIIGLDGQEWGKEVRTIRPSAGGQCIEPTWSHDGRLAFVSFSRDTSSTIRTTTLYTTNGDGSNERAVATLPDAAQWISWSPDDRWIALQNDNMKNSNGNIVIVDVTTGAFHTITYHDRPYFDETPSWSSDRTIYFQSNRSGAYAIYCMKADGSDVRRLTH